MIDPLTIPRIDGDMEALIGHADELTRTAAAIAETGGRIHSTWQQLAAVYDAPEASELFAATGPVAGTSASVGEDLGDAAAALRAYANETTGIKTRVDALRGQATELVAAAGGAQDESTMVVLDGRSAELSAAVEAEVAAWEASQRRCANALYQLTSEAPAPAQAPTAVAVDPRGPLLGTPPAPPLPTWEGFPVDPFPLPGTTGDPPVVVDPGPLINVPAPPLPGPLINVPAPPLPGVVDGPGSYPAPLGGGILFDRAAATPGGATEPVGEEAPPPVPQEVGKLFEGGRVPTASELEDFAEKQGWERTQTENGPPKYLDENGVRRITIKEGTPRAPGSEGPHVELRDAAGQRVDPQGNPVTRKSTGNHTEIIWDLDR